MDFLTSEVPIGFCDVRIGNSDGLDFLIEGHGGRVVTLSPPTSEAGVRFPAQPQVGKLVVAWLKTPPTPISLTWPPLFNMYQWLKPSLTTIFFTCKMSYLMIRFVKYFWSGPK